VLVGSALAIVSTTRMISLFLGIRRLERRASSFLPSANPASALVRPAFRSIPRLPGPRFVLNRVAAFVSFLPVVPAPVLLSYLTSISGACPTIDVRNPRFFRRALSSTTTTTITNIISPPPSPTLHIRP
jgi:hypothetical protein